MVEAEATEVTASTTAIPMVTATLAVEATKTILSPTDGQPCLQLLAGSEDKVAPWRSRRLLRTMRSVQWEISSGHIGLLGLLLLSQHRLAGQILLVPQARCMPSDISHRQRQLAERQIRLLGLRIRILHISSSSRIHMRIHSHSSHHHCPYNKLHLN